jgi:hypothetical protein
MIRKEISKKIRKKVMKVVIRKVIMIRKSMDNLVKLSRVGCQQNLVISDFARLKHLLVEPISFKFKRQWGRHWQQLL